MKRLILLLLSVAPAALFAQEKYTIKGNIGSIDAPAKVFLTYYNGAVAKTDSTSIVKGAFTFSGEVKDITQASLIIDYQGIGIQNLKQRSTKIETFVYLVNGITKISSPDSLINAKITGTRVNEDYHRYISFLKPAYDSERKLNHMLRTVSKEKRQTQSFTDSVNQQESIIDGQFADLDKQYINKNPDSYISLRALKEIGSYNPDINEIEPLFNKLSPSVRATAAGIAYQKYLDALKATLVGAIAPEFSMPDTDGNKVNLSSFRGKYVLLDFWASWCPPCRAESPNMVKAYNNFKGKNFTILSVSLDQPGKRDAWLKAIHNDHLTWTQVSELKYWDSETAKLYGIRSVPQNFLIDPSGKIIAKDLRGSDLDAKLTAIFGKM